MRALTLDGNLQIWREGNAIPIGIAKMVQPKKSYIISCTPRSGSHLLSSGLGSTGIAGIPVERFPRTLGKTSITAADRDAYVTQAPPESSYDDALDAEYIGQIIEKGTTPNGVFGINIHWFQVIDAVRRIGPYLRRKDISPADAFSMAFPGLSYIWLRRRDKVAQAVSWYKAIHTGYYTQPRDASKPAKLQTTELEFDYAKIRTYLYALKSSDNGWEHYFSSNKIEPLIIYYEDISKNFAPSVRDALRYLGLDSENTFIDVPKYQKVGDKRSSDWIERFKSAQSVARSGVNRF